ETSIVSRSNRAKRKTAENSTLSNSAEQGIDSNDVQVISAKKKRVCQNKTRPRNEESEHTKHFKVRRLNCLVDDCNRFFPDAPRLNQHLVEHDILQYRCLVAGYVQSFSNT